LLTAVTLMTNQQQHGPPMTLGNMRQLGVQRLVAHCLNDMERGLKLLPDAYAGLQGRVNNYISFDIEGAKRVRADLDSCIAEYQQLTRFGRAGFGQKDSELPR
jgi:hypothetical protein